MTNNSRWVACALLALGCAACDQTSETELATLGHVELALDDVSAPPRGAQLIVLDDGTDLRAFSDALQRLGGKPLHLLPPRLLVGEVPDGSDAVLRDLGMSQRFARAVDPAELEVTGVDAARFARVFSNRYYADALPRDQRLAPTRQVLPPGEAFEEPPQVTAAATRAVASAGRGGDPIEDDRVAWENERGVSTPYASGTVVVSVWLPESNGKAEENLEDWSEELIQETQAKLQAALEAIARHEPNARLRFILHYESAPAPGGLPGTLDTDWEYGRHTRDWQVMNQIRAQLLSGVLGRVVDPNEYYRERSAYLADLRERYDADGVFAIYVAPNARQQASFRAFASINGPDTSVHTGNGWEVFMHELGHIFGALDEYCPDQCRHPSSLQGYFGIVNANAVFRAGEGGGIDGGHGESQPSLMIANVVNGVNGYTRGAWGWLDSDGDGLLEPLDTLPTTYLTASARHGELSLAGLIKDVPAASLFRTPFSSNRIAALHYRFVGARPTPWIRLPIDGRTRGREHVELDLGGLPAGSYRLEVRAENSVGNLQPAAQTLDVEVREDATEIAPHVSLAAFPRVQSLRGRVTLSPSAFDLQGEALRARFDFDGDGRFDTEFGPLGDVSFTPARAGVLRPIVEVEDARGLRRSAQAEVFVLEGNAPPALSLSDTPSLRFGTSTAAFTWEGRGVDGDGGPVELNWRLELDDARRLAPQAETGFAEGQERFEAQLTTPLELIKRSLDLPTLLTSGARIVHDAALVAPDVIALAVGGAGLAFVDIEDPTTPRLLSELPLQTAARDLLLHDGRLYVLGGQLTVVDVRDPAQPVELPQVRTIERSRRAVDNETYPIGELGSLREPAIYAPWDERIERLGVRVAVRHPYPAHLTIELAGPEKQRTLLQQALPPCTKPEPDAGPKPEARAGVLRPVPEPPACGEPGDEPDYGWRPTSTPGVYARRFTPRDTPALKALQGQFASDTWTLSVLDEVADGVNGEVVRFGVRFETAHRAAPVHLGARLLVGALDDDHLVVAGRGVEVLSTTFPEWIHRAAYRPGTYVDSAALVDHAVLVASELEPKKERRGLLAEHGERATAAGLRGLYALDLWFPYFPRLLRQEPLRRGELAQVGSRFYLRVFPPEPVDHKHRTEVGDVRAFLEGEDYVLGTSDYAVSREAFGDDQILWNPDTEVSQLDVSDPTSLRALQRFARPRLGRARALDTQRLLELDKAALLDLREQRSILSGVYRVTLEGRDDSGAVATQSRTVHMVPYNHAPQILSARVTAGRTTRDEFQLEVQLHDPDGRPSWDPSLALRVDLDGDGIFEERWQSVWGDAPLALSTRFAEPGTHVIRLQARDGFYALSEVVELPVEVAAYVPVPCDDSEQCPEGEYCQFGEDAACGATAQGVCERPRDDCAFEEPVCGCDGTTYRNACVAQARGVSPAYAGFCEGDPTTCRASEDCTGDGQFCYYDTAEDPALSCGDDGTVGTCRFAPEACFRPLAQAAAEPSRPADLFPPRYEVCGCDDVTYPSACEANRAGVSVRKYERCEPDCRTLGCAEGETCLGCYAGYVCLPEGSACIL